MRSSFSFFRALPVPFGFKQEAVLACLGAATLALSTGMPVPPALAQETGSVPENASQTAEVQIDVEAVYRQALEAEWDGDYARARELYGPAAEAGHARSHYQLGFLFMDGLGGSRDVEQGRYHLRQAADGGIALALVSLVYTYDDQDDPTVAPDPVLASRSLLELSQRDLASAGDTIMFWSQPLRRQIQRDLRDAGHYRGAIDGLIGQGSLNALRAFARARTELPELARQRFESVVINADGIALDGGTPTPLDRIETLADLRSALETLPVIATDESHWRVLSGDEPVLDWPRPSLDRDEGGRAATTFQLPGKPTGTDLTLGEPIDNFADLDWSLCAVRATDEGEYAGRYVRRCETRVPGVQLVFVAQNGPSPDLEAEVARMHGERDAEPRGETLAAIEINPPLALRLAGN